MSEIIVLIGILFILFISMFTLILSLLLSSIRNIRIRHLLPPACGIALYFVIVIFPHVIPGFPTFFASLQPLSPLLLLPFFILAPLPYIEQKTGTIFGWLHILFGAAVTTVYFFIVSLNGMFFIIQKWQAGLPEWTISSVVLSALMFLGIYFLQQYFSLVPEENQEKTGTIRNNSLLGIRTKKIIIIAAWLLVLGSPFFLLGPVFQPDPCGSFPVFRIDENRSLEGSFHLTDQKLKEFPKLESLIKNSHNVQQQNLTISIYQKETKVTDLGSIKFSCNEESYRSMSNTYIEYNGTLYYTGISWIS
jgi:hypothetical protein